MKIKLIVVSLLWFQVQFAEANIFQLDSYTGASIGKLSRDTYAKDPLISGFSEDASVTYSFGSFGVGIGAAFRIVNDLSEGDPSIGNLRGHRWEIYPTFWIIPGASFKVSVSPLIKLGKYNLSNDTAALTSIGYGNPLGVRAFVTYYPFASKNYGVSLFGDYTAYGIQTEKESSGNSLEDVELSSKLKFWSVGIAFNFVLPL